MDKFGAGGRNLSAIAAYEIYAKGGRKKRSGFALLMEDFGGW
jgi:hypothetical protein